MKKLIYSSAIIIVFSLAVFAQTEDPVSPGETNAKTKELIKRAIRLEDAGLFKSAIDTYLEVLEIEPNDFKAMNVIAGIYGKMGNGEKEEEWAKKCIDTKPEFALCYINYGNGLALQQKYDEAIKSYEKAAELDPKSPLPVYSIGFVAEEQRDLKKALEYYKKSVEIDPKFENGLFSAAAMHANLKQFDEAITLLKKLLEINPEAEDARGMLVAIEREKAGQKLP